MELLIIFGIFFACIISVVFIHIKGKINLNRKLATLEKKHREKMEGFDKKWSEEYRKGEMEIAQAKAEVARAKKQVEDDFEKLYQEFKKHNPQPERRSKDG